MAFLGGCGVSLRLKEIPVQFVDGGRQKAPWHSHMRFAVISPRAIHKYVYRDDMMTLQT